MDADTLVPIIVAAVVGGSLTGGIVALFKMRPETGAIIVSAAQGAVVVQASVINDLNAENRRLRERVTALELEREQDRERMAALERRLAALQAEVHEDKAP